MTYATEKGTIVLRVNVDEVVLGGGKIQLPVLVDDWTKSKAVTQYCVRGSLHPDTLVIAVENFTQKRVPEGLLVYTAVASTSASGNDGTSKRRGGMIFDFAQLASGCIYATAEDNIMLERAAEPPYINFTFGRNLYWYVKSQKEKYAHGGALHGKENDGMQRTPTKASTLTPGRSPHQRRHGNNKSPKSSSDFQTAAGGVWSQTIGDAPPPPPPVPAALRTLKLDANGIPLCGTPPPPPGTKKRNRKVRQLHWTKIPQNQLAGTIWREKGSPSRIAVDIDVDEVENMFSLSPMKDALGNPLSAFGTKLSSDAPQAAVCEKANLLDLKRANNGAVLLSQFKRLDYMQIRNALMTMDERRELSIENLISLKYLFPLTDQERHDFVNFKGDAAKQCGPAEQFYLATLDVPRPDVRVRMLIFRLQFDDVRQHLEAATHILRQSAQELMDSDKLAQVLQLVLKLGRALNDGNTSSVHYGSASGFRLDSLARLADTKAKDKKTSILDYLVSLTKRQKPELIEFWSETPYLEHITKLPTETISEGLKEIKDSLDALKLELELIAVNMSAEMSALSNNIASKFKASQSATKNASEMNLSSSSFSDALPSFNMELSASSDDVITRSSSSSAEISIRVPGEQTESSAEVEHVDSKHADAYFKAHMAEYYESCLAHYLGSKKRYEVAVHTFEKAAKYFGEDPKSSTPASFFTLISNFVDNWKAANAKIDNAAAEKERNEQRQAKIAEKARLAEEAKIAKIAAEEAQRIAKEEEEATRAAMEAEKMDDVAPTTTMQQNTELQTLDIDENEFENANETLEVAVEAIAEEKFEGEIGTENINASSDVLASVCDSEQIVDDLLGLQVANEDEIYANESEDEEEGEDPLQMSHFVPVWTSPVRSTDISTEILAENMTPWITIEETTAEASGEEEKFEDEEDDSFVPFEEMVQSSFLEF